MRRTTDSDAMNQVGKPDAGNPHVRFDEREQETGSRLPRLFSTLLKGCSNSVKGLIEFIVADRYDEYVAKRAH